MIHKTTRSILSVLLAALLLVTSTPLTPAFAGGGGVSLQSESAEGRVLKPVDGVYQIYTADDLKEFAKLVNGGKTDAHAKLMNDIDLSSVCGESLNGGTSWNPIGSDSSRYSGTFDGDGHTISGLYINRSADYQGLFGYVSTDGDNTGTVKDLTVSGSVSGNNFVGGVAGYNSGTFENCAFTGSVSGLSPVGGVVGDNRGSVENCYNTGSVTSSESPVGGVVGWNSGNVTNCYNTGTVSCTSNSSDVGGVGGVVGDNYDGASVENCYNTGTVNVSSNRSVGGVVGYNSGSSTVTGCYFLKTETVNKDLQGIGNVSGSGGAAAVNDLPELCEKFKGVTGWETNTILKRPVLTSNHEDDGTQAHPYRISTATQLKNFATAVNDGSEKSAHAKLMNDIDLSSVCSKEEGNWTPIGNDAHQYIGTFDGNGKTIENLYINTTDSGADNQGLFGCLDQGGTVQNLSVSGTVNSSGDYVGGIVGYNSGNVTVQNCTFSGDVNSSGDYVGGIVGDNSGTVTGCAFSGSVKGNNYVGGVVGDNVGSVENCYNTGAVNSSVSGNRSVGGVVGDNSGPVKNCYNTGTVTGTDDYVGGVVGDNGGPVENCYNTGKVSDGTYTGGVVGQNINGTVENCYNTGTVTGTDDYVGGVVGLNNGNVTGCYNTGSVTSSGSPVGGVVGYNSGGNVTGCYFLQQDPAIYGIGNTTKDDISQTAAKSLEDFHSGEVAYLLQSKQTAGSSQVWGQTLGGEEDSLPTLNPTDEQKVYQVTFDYGDSFTETDDQYDYHYANANDNVTLPTSTDQIPEYEGHTLTGWQNGTTTYQAGEEVEITADTEFTAQWTKDTVNYTVTVSADPEAGGTVNGGGTFTENDSVTVSATPASGYTFVEWQEDGEKIENAAATYTFELTGNRNLTAIFEKDEDPTPTPTPTPDPTPSGPSTGDSSGWDDIRDELENAEKGDEITIDMGDETKVPAEIFESLAGKDVDVTFDLGDIQWSVNGADIPTDTDFTDLDLGASLGTSGIPVNVINTITGEVGTVQITLAHDGAFGFTMTLSAPLGKENAGYWANLYHYDEEAEALNFEAAAKIDEDGSVTIPFSHASQYAIVIDTHSHAAVDVSDLFIDIAPDAWYKDAVQYAYDNGLMTGTSANEFAPEQTTTRAMIVSILARLENVTSAEAAGFADVNDNDWYATAVNWAANVGVVNGYEDNTFRPNTAITREQLAAILMNYAAYKGYDVSARADLSHYSDADSISSWANDVLLWAVAEGLLTGVTDDTIAPQAHATRAQVAAILQRFLSE